MKGLIKKTKKTKTSLKNLRTLANSLKRDFIADYLKNDCKTNKMATRCLRVVKWIRTGSNKSK